ALLLHAIEHFCPTGDAGCMLRDSHQFIVCIERTALTEDDRIRVHDASHHFRFLGLRRGGLRQGGAGTVSVGSAFRAKRRAAAPHLHSVSTWEDVPMPDVC
ncbi:hypothetical protein ACM8AB_33155, partial [Pseudomonas aeruginosa]